MPPVTSQSVKTTPLSADAKMAPPFTAQSQRFVPQPEEPLAGEAPPWDIVMEEGHAEPAFEADVDEMEAALALFGEPPRQEAEFPLDAFIIPEETTHMPTGVETPEAREEPKRSAVDELAERLEKLSHRLRIDDTPAVLERLAAGDKLDAMLAGLLAGYLAGKK
jgi:hypothetical protein